MRNKASDIMTKARTNLIFDHPFFGVLALRTRIIEDPGCGTACCDGPTIGNDPEYISKLSSPEAIGILNHELYHKALFHPLRRGAREPAKWNIACDYAENLLIQPLRGVKLPT